MSTLRETLSVSRQCAAAVRCHTPARLAQFFAAFEGQFYDRTSFDDLARQCSALFEPADADTFRTCLDRRLRHRTAAPVAWETATEAIIPPPVGRPR